MLQLHQRLTAAFGRVYLLSGQAAVPMRNRPMSGLKIISVIASARNGPDDGE